MASPIESYDIGVQQLGSFLVLSSLPTRPGPSLALSSSCTSYILPLLSISYFVCFKALVCWLVPCYFPPSAALFARPAIAHAPRF